MNKILEYQRLDIELNKAKKSSVNNVDKENMAKLKSYIVDAHSKGFQLENDADALLKEYMQLKKQYDANCNKVQSLTSKDMNSISLDDIDSILSTINSLSSELFSLERNINIIINKIKASLKEFEVTKNNIIKAKQKYNALKSKCEQDLKNVAPRLKEIEDKMASLEKELDPELFAKYKSIKADKIFPVFVSLNDGHCSGCRVEIPTSKINKLKNDGMIVCEQCHRLIYMK